MPKKVSLLDSSMKVKSGFQARPKGVVDGNQSNQSAIIVVTPHTFSWQRGYELLLGDGT